MKKISILFMLVFLLISSQSILACDFYENERVLRIILDTGSYKSQNISGTVCSHDNKSVVIIKKGKADGPAKIYLIGDLVYTDEGLTEVNFKNGVRHGVYKEYYKSGELYSEVNYINGKIEGVYKEYYESGELWGEVHYINDKKEGLEKVYYESSTLQVERNYKNGKQEGLEKWYYSSGALRFKVHYINNYKEGVKKVYLENGDLYAELYYRNHNLISGKCADGRVLTDEELLGLRLSYERLDVKCDDYDFFD